VDNLCIPVGQVISNNSNSLSMTQELKRFLLICFYTCCLFGSTIFLNFSIESNDSALKYVIYALWVLISLAFLYELFKFIKIINRKDT